MTGPWTQFSSAIANDHVLASLLVSGPLRNVAQEERMTALRRRCLQAGNAPLELLAHLAIQCFLNEYAWRETPAETAAVERLSDRRDPRGLLTLAAYRPLSDLPDLPDLGDSSQPDAVRAVLRVQVADVALERRLAAEVEAITPIRAGLSETVQAQYEENPYPRWAVLPDARRRPLAEIVAASAGRPVEAPEEPEVLVAGCGTGRHAIQTARNYAGAQVLAVDLSRASLGYALRRTREIGVPNLTYGQADILELPALGRTFDVIEAVGSLQCMDDPGEGLATLTSMLRPGGFVRLGLYSARAREPLAAAMRLGQSFPRTPQGIRAFRTAVLDAQPGSDVRAAVEFPDFFAASGCRDLLLHVKEHTHTLPQVRALLEANGLEFLGFDLPDVVRQKFRGEFSDETDLDQWAQFEDRHPATFRAMYQVWARKRP